MSRKFTFWLDSGANIHSRRSETMSLEEMGLDEQEFDEMSDDEKEAFFRDWAFAQSEWGWEEEE